VPPAKRVSVTDIELLHCVKRAAGGLKSLCVRNCWALTARGVVAALSAEPSGLLVLLSVAGIQGVEGDDNVVDELQSFAARPLDVRTHALCTAPDGDNDARCARLCIDALCWECDIARCGFCAPLHKPLCEHVCFQCHGGPPLGVDFDQRELNRQSYSLAEAYVIAVCTFDGARGKHDLFECCVCHGYSCLTRCAEGVLPCSRLVVDDWRGPDRDWDSECPGRRIFCLDCACTHTSLCPQCLQNFCAECLQDNGGVCPKCGTVCDGSLNHWQ
jgi:hypothetical protein